MSELIESDPTVEDLLPIVKRLKGCSNGYCRVKGVAKGQHTNGRCGCLDWLSNPLRSDIARKLKELREANDIHDEVIGWNELRCNHLGDLFDRWGYSYSTHQLVYDIYSKKLSDNSIFRVWVSWHALEIECERQGRLRFQPRSVNDVKAILRSIDPALVGE